MTAARNPIDRLSPDRPTLQVVAPASYLEPLLSRWQAGVYWLLVAAWVAAEIHFWAWWLRPEHWVTVTGMVVNSAILVWLTVVPAWFLIFTGRMRRPRQLPAPTGLRVAMIVTKAPSEPWPVVQATLIGMLRQEYPTRYDIWLADEAPDKETRAWCWAFGVKVCTRQGVVDYHRPTWPRRTRCKEGNLAYFYDHWGYERYDVVVQLDADHVPAPGYLREMMRPFNDPRVGYVAAPSICGANQRESWAARGRLHADATLHGPLQAGHNQGYAPICVGSHYAVRTRALRQVGGLGPELAEDYTTTLRLSAGGWQGVFALDAQALGDGPATFADCMTQEFQWSRSMTAVLLKHLRASWGPLTSRERLHYGMLAVWYPLHALLLLVGSVLPALALVTGVPWVSVSLPIFVVMFGTPGVVLVMILWWLRRLKVLRPVSVPLVSWEAGVYQITRWPWVAWGVIQACLAAITGRESTFKVTQKGVRGRQPYPLVALSPSLAIAGVSAAAVLLIPDPGPARGYVTLCLVDAALYFGAVLIVLRQHWRENHRVGTSVVPRPGWRAVAALSLVALLLAVALTRETIGLTLVPDLGGLVEALAPLTDRSPLREQLVGVLTAAR